MLSSDHSRAPKKARGSMTMARRPIVAARPSYKPLVSYSARSQLPVMEDENETYQMMDQDDFPMDNDTNNVETEQLNSPDDFDRIASDPASSPVVDHSFGPESATQGVETQEIPAESQKISLTKTNKKFKLEDVERITAKSKPVATASTAFKPDLGAASMQGFADVNYVNSSQEDAGLSSIASGACKIDPKLWLKNKTPAALTDGESQSAEVGTLSQDEEYMNMYWTDATENNGLIYLFGKVLIEEPDAKQRKFVSCCVTIHGCERNLFVLPRVVPNKFKEDGRPCRMGMADVYKELGSLLVPDIIPRTAGQTFRVKSVKRSYAFEYESVPREETEYMKVVYSAKHGVPLTAHCSGGKTYERIFGATSSPLELFLLKRKLMGPCWIKIKNPKLSSDQMSWCKLEVAITDPKFVSKNVSTQECGSPPPFVSMSVSIKTAVNPVTHLHEIIALSALVHRGIDSEIDSPNEHKFMNQYTYIRQLGLSCGESYPASFPHDIQAHVKKISHAKSTIQTMTNERALISLFLVRLQQEDPDILVSHNLLGFEFDVILSRAIANKLPNWSLLGRLKKSKPPRGINDKDVAAGRILCDTYKAAKEFLRETTYSLTHLAATQLGATRPEVDPIDVPRYFSTSADITNLIRHTMNDAFLVQGLMLKLQVIPLTKQLTNLSGNLWSRTIRGARAERIEYLLLHEFHALKYILPEKKAYDNNKKGRPAGMDEDADPTEGKVGGTSRNRSKAAYAGGLVLEPKKGLYDTFILLLDFNSLYPSIIQEYNLCFTTIEWSKFMPETKPVVTTDVSSTKSKKSKKAKVKDAVADVNDDEDADSDAGDIDGDDVEGAIAASSLPPLPDTASAAGVLPRVIKTLVDRRRTVKNLLKKEKDVLQKQQLDIRQKALKLTANSMYGCLGFSFSRFYARPIAALVTAMGREALQRTVDLATNQLSLDVIYGDTDSVMINTNSTDLASVKDVGNLVKKEVNKLYRSLELDLDGIFKSMLLLKKKKYAAVLIKEEADGTVSLEKEMKGLDLVRRDWCPISKNAGKFVVDQILSGKSREEIVISIHEYITNLSNNIRAGILEVQEFVVTKGLNKNPRDYPDCKGQAHLQVALQMLKANKPVNIGDHIPYVICKEGPDGATPAQRAYHPDEVLRSIQDNTGEYTIDYEWYLTNQILPPISRLCEPIEGTSPAILSQCMGLDASK